MHNAPVPLTELTTFEEGLIVEVNGPEADQLAGYGLYPGMTVRVHQTFPSFVIKAEETEVALETQVARLIRVIRTNAPGQEHLTAGSGKNTSG